MQFWIKHLSVAVVFLLLGIYVVINEKQFLSQDPLTSHNQQTKNETNDKAALQGFSQFYTKLRSNVDTMFDPEREQYVIELKQKNSSLTDELMRIGVSTNPIRASWTGPLKNRRFIQGDTLRKRMKEIATEDNMNLIWWLERDFIVKLPFRVEETTVGTLYYISTAIDSDFEKDVYSFFCPKQRALVITDTIEPYIRKNCARGRSMNSR